MKIVGVILTLILNFRSSPTIDISKVSLESETHKQNLSMDVLDLCTASANCNRYMYKMADDSN